MPTRWSGTAEERMARLENAGRRCDGNSRHCTRSAVEVYEVTRLKSDGTPESGDVESKKSCGYHRAQFLESAFYKVLSNRELRKMDPWAKKVV